MPQAENPPSKIFAQPLAIGLGAALLLGYAVITVHAIYEKLHRASIERVETVYAVEDKACFPKSFDVTLPLVNFGGHSLYYVDHSPAMDSAMTRIGLDDTNTYSIYKSTVAKGDDAALFYLKVGTDDYIRAKRE